MTIRLLKSFGNNSPGDVISVPYLKGLELLKDGVGVRPGETQVASSAPSAPPTVAVESAAQPAKKK